MGRERNTGSTGVQGEGTDQELPVKPKALRKEHLQFLDNLRESGETNMYGSPRYLREGFSELTKNDASEIVSYWMKTFSLRHG